MNMFIWLLLGTLIGFAVIMYLVNRRLTRLLVSSRDFTDEVIGTAETQIQTVKAEHGKALERYLLDTAFRAEEYANRLRITRQVGRLSEYRGTGLELALVPYLPQLLHQPAQMDAASALSGRDWVWTLIERTCYERLDLLETLITQYDLNGSLVAVTGLKPENDSKQQ